MRGCPSQAPIKTLSTTPGSSGSVSTLPSEDPVVSGIGGTAAPIDSRRLEIRSTADAATDTTVGRHPLIDPRPPDVEQRTHRHTAQPTSVAVLSAVVSQALAGSVHARIASSSPRRPMRPPSQHSSRPGRRNLRRSVTPTTVLHETGTTHWTNGGRPAEDGRAAGEPCRGPSGTLAADSARSSALDATGALAADSTASSATVGTRRVPVAWSAARSRPP